GWTALSLMSGFHNRFGLFETLFCRIDSWYTRKYFKSVLSFLPAQTTARMQVEMANPNAKKLNRRKQSEQSRMRSQTEVQRRQEEITEQKPRASADQFYALSISFRSQAREKFQ